MRQPQDDQVELPPAGEADRRAWLRDVSRWAVFGALALWGGLVTARGQWSRRECAGPTACGGCPLSDQCRRSRSAEIESGREGQALCLPEAMKQ